MPLAAAAFDAIASNYDDLWTTTPVGLSQRRAVWRGIDRLFFVGQLIFDLGCGTGADAAHLESRGVYVFGVDSSPEMVRVARSKGVAADCLTLEQAARTGWQFDGALCNFGVLNCLPDLDAAAAQFASLVRPGGYLVICVMGPCCLWEICHFLGRADWTRAFRRFSGSCVQASVGLRVWYPRRRDLCAAFRRYFQLCSWRGVGLCVPPSYIRNLSPSVIRTLAVLDRWLAHLPFLRGLADHRLFVFQRL